MKSLLPIINSTLFKETQTECSQWIKFETSTKLVNERIKAVHQTNKHIERLSLSIKSEILKELNENSK